jgi:hypothetical protein
VAWCLALWLCIKGHSRFLPLGILLGLTLALELAAEWCIYWSCSFKWLYHIYVVIEYSLLCWYFIRASRTPYTPLIKYSIPVFALLSVIISAEVYHFKEFPGLNINLAGMFVSVICTGVLINLDSKIHNTIRGHPDFWIGCGLLVFYAGTFFSNGLYSYLMSLDRNHALQLFDVVNKPLNIILYSCLITGFVCAIPRKSSTLSS